MISAGDTKAGKTQLMLPSGTGVVVQPFDFGAFSPYDWSSPAKPDNYVMVDAAPIAGKDAEQSRWRFDAPVYVIGAAVANPTTESLAKIIQKPGVLEALIAEAEQVQIPLGEALNTIANSNAIKEPGVTDLKSLLENGKKADATARYAMDANRMESSVRNWKTYRDLLKEVAVARDKLGALTRGTQAYDATKGAFDRAVSRLLVHGRNLRDFESVLRAAGEAPSMSGILTRELTEGRLRIPTYSPPPGSLRHADIFVAGSTPDELLARAASEAKVEIVIRQPKPGAVVRAKVGARGGTDGATGTAAADDVVSPSRVGAVVDESSAARPVAVSRNSTLASVPEKVDTPVAHAPTEMMPAMRDGSDGRTITVGERTLADMRAAAERPATAACTSDKVVLLKEDMIKTTLRPAISSTPAATAADDATGVVRAAAQATSELPPPGAVGALDDVAAVSRVPQSSGIAWSKFVTPLGVLGTLVGGALLVFQGINLSREVEAKDELLKRNDVGDAEKSASEYKVTASEVSFGAGAVAFFGGLLTLGAKALGWITVAGGSAVASTVGLVVGCAALPVYLHYKGKEDDEFNGRVSDLLVDELNNQNLDALEKRAQGQVPDRLTSMAVLMALTKVAQSNPNIMRDSTFWSNPDYRFRDMLNVMISRLDGSRGLERPSSNEVSDMMMAWALFLSYHSDQTTFEATKDRAGFMRQDMGMNCAFPKFDELRSDLGVRGVPQSQQLCELPAIGSQTTRPAGALPDPIVTPLNQEMPPVKTVPVSPVQVAPALHNPTRKDASEPRGLPRPPATSDESDSMPGLPAPPSPPETLPMPPAVVHPAMPEPVPAPVTPPIVEHEAETPTPPPPHETKPSVPPAKPHTPDMAKETDDEEDPDPSDEEF